MKEILHIEQMIFLRLLTRYSKETVHGGGLSKEDIELFMEFCERNKREKAEMEHDD